MEAGNLPVEPPSTYRVSGGLMIGSGVLNVAMASIWVLSLGWICIGLLWIVPMAVAVGEVVVGVLVVLGVPIRFGPVAAMAGIVNGSLLFSPVSLAMQVLALVFLHQDDARRFVALPGPGPGSQEGPPS